MTRAQSLADLRKHSTGEWTVVVADADANERNAGALNLGALAADLGADVTGVTGKAPTEHAEQVALFAWAEMAQAQHPELAMLAAIPNGGYRPMTTAAMLKAEGVKAGYPDIVLDVARGRWHGLRIELKRADHSNGPTQAQREWIERLRYHGYSAVVCYGCDEAINTIMAYLAQEG